MGKITEAEKSGKTDTTSPPRNQTISPNFFSRIAKIVTILTTFIVYMLVIPIFLVFVSPLFLYRVTVIKIAKCFRPDLIKIVCTRDGVVGLDDVTAKCQCVLNVMLTCTGDPDIELIRTVFQKKVMDARDKKGGLAYEKFAQYYESFMGYAFWKRENYFKLNEHIRFCEDTTSKTNNNEDDEEKMITNEEVLMRTLGPISTRPFPKKFSPWEILIIPNFVPSDGRFSPKSGSCKEKRYVLLFRIHHAISDGYSIVKLIVSNLSDVPVDKISAPPAKKMGLLQKLSTYFGILFLSPYYHLKQFVVDVDRNFWHLRENELTRDWFTIRSENIPLVDIKRVSKCEKMTTTAVLLASFGGGIRNYLIEIGEEKRIPSVMRALAPMPWKNHPMDGLVNHWTLGFMVLPVGSQGYKQRLQVAEKSVQKLKTTPILFTNFGTVPFLLAPPRFLTDIWATNWMTTMVLSNFAGPNFQVKMFERDYIEDVTFWLPQMRGSSSVGVAFLSYNGGLRVTATIDKKIVPSQKHADLLSECINQEFANMIDRTEQMGENVV